MSRVEHVKANARLVGVAPATADDFTKLFRAAKGLEERFNAEDSKTQSSQIKEKI